MVTTTSLFAYIRRVGTALSVLLNVVTGGASNQTFSARNYEWEKNGQINIVWLLDFILGEDHCVQCWVYWRVREDKW